MGVADALEEAKAAAREWRSLREMPAPRVLSADAIPAHLVEVRAAYERRTLENDVAPAPAAATPSEPPKPDPWSIEIETPDGGEPWSTRVPLEDARGVVTCFLCKGARSFPCDDCEGTGQKLVEEYEPITGTTRRYYVPCGTCGAKGQLRCDTCRGSALVEVTRVAVVEVGTDTHFELEHGGRLDPQLVSEILGSGSAVPLGGDVVCELEDGSDPPRGALPDRVAALVRGMMARPDAAGGRTRSRRARVLDGWVVELKLKDRVLHVWGDPPRVAGDDDPVERGGALLWLGAGLAAAAAVGASLYFLL